MFFGFNNVGTGIEAVKFLDISSHRPVTLSATLVEMVKAILVVRR